MKGGGGDKLSDFGNFLNVCARIFIFNANVSRRKMLWLENMGYQTSFSHRMLSTVVEEHIYMFLCTVSASQMWYSSLVVVIDIRKVEIPHPP